MADPLHFFPAEGAIQKNVEEDFVILFFYSVLQLWAFQIYSIFKSQYFICARVHEKWKHDQVWRIWEDKKRVKCGERDLLISF